MRHQTAVAVVTVLAFLLAGVAMPVGAAQSSSTAPRSPASMQEQCQTTVTHDAFLTDNSTVEQLRNNSKASSIVDNTRVTVAETSGFYRVKGENPNGYCVAFTVRVSDKAIPAAQIPGEVTSNDGKHSATWKAIHNFNTSQTYTEVKFVLPANTTATFAPSEARVLSLSWVSERAKKAESIGDKLTQKLFDKDLQKKTYTINPDGKQEVTVPLQNPNTDEKVTEWQAMFTTDGGDTWKPVKRESTDPVYITMKNEQQVTFRFNNPDAKVRFTANPDTLDKANYQVKSYLSGIPFIGDDESSLLVPPMPSEVGR